MKLRRRRRPGPRARVLRELVKVYPYPLTGRQIRKAARIRNGRTPATLAALLDEGLISYGWGDGGRALAVQYWLTPKGLLADLPGGGQQ